jgi:hypothetical protein
MRRYDSCAPLTLSADSGSAAYLNITIRCSAYSCNQEPEGPAPAFPAAARRRRAVPDSPTSPPGYFVLKLGTRAAVTARVLSLQLVHAQPAHPDRIEKQTGNTFGPSVAN